MRGVTWTPGSDRMPVVQGSLFLSVLFNEDARIYVMLDNSISGSMAFYVLPTVPSLNVDQTKRLCAPNG